jgi:hypothetical protein
MLTAGFNPRGQTLLHFGTIGLRPKSKRTWILYSAECAQPGYTSQQNRGRSGDRPRTKFGFDEARFNALARLPSASLRSSRQAAPDRQFGNYPFWTVGPRR